MSAIALEEKTDLVDKFSAQEFNQSLREINNSLYQVINKTGLDLTTVRKGLDIYSNARMSGFSVGGTADAITLTSSGCFADMPILDYFNGMMVFFKPTLNNTGATTINIDTLGAKDIKTLLNSALQGGMLNNNGYATIRYNGTYFELVKGADVGGAGIVKQSTITHNLNDPIFNNPSMTSNTLPAGYIASATTNDSTAWRLFDNTATAWASTTSPVFPQNLTLQSPLAQYIQQVTILNTSTGNVHIRDAIIQGSTNGSIWTDLLTITNRPNAINYSETYAINSAVKYSYVRVVVNSYWGTNATLQVQEITISYGRNTLTQSIGFVNAKNYSQYINFTSTSNLDMTTTGLNGRATGVSLTQNTWYYIFVSAKTDGTTGILIDSSETGANANATFTTLGFDINKTILVGVWQTQSANTNLRSDLMNYASYKYNYLNQAEAVLASGLVTLPLYPILNVKATLIVNTSANNVGGLYQRYRGSPTYQGIAQNYTNLTVAPLNGALRSFTVLTDNGSVYTDNYISSVWYLPSYFEILP